MTEAYKIVITEKPEWAIIGGGINRFNIQQAGEDSAKSLCFVLKNPELETVGGVIGSTYWDWLHVDLMWIEEGLRGLGYGHQLLSMAEDEARRRGAKRAYLDTFSFQAPGFYEKYGYKTFGLLEDFPTGHQRFFLVKDL